MNENKANNDNSKSNNVKVSNNSNQTQNWNSNDNQIKMQISKADEENNKDSKENNNNELNKKDNNQFSLKIQSNFISANGKYVKHINTLASIRSKSKNGDTKYKNNKHLNINIDLEVINSWNLPKGLKLHINKDHLQPLIHFTNLSSKKLKILGSNSKIKSDSDNK